MFGRLFDRSGLGVGRSARRLDGVGAREAVVLGIEVEVLTDLLADPLGGAPELAHGLSDGAADLGQTLGTEHDQCDDQDQQEFFWADVEHCSEAPRKAARTGFYGRSLAPAPFAGTFAGRAPTFPWASAARAWMASAIGWRSSRNRAAVLDSALSCRNSANRRTRTSSVAGIVVARTTNRTTAAGYSRRGRRIRWRAAPAGRPHRPPAGSGTRSDRPR